MSLAYRVLILHDPEEEHNFSNQQRCNEVLVNGVSVALQISEIQRKTSAKCTNFHTLNDTPNMSIFKVIVGLLTTPCVIALINNKYESKAVA